MSFTLRKTVFVDTDCAVDVIAPSLSVQWARTSQRTRVPTEIVCEMAQPPDFAELLSVSQVPIEEVAEVLRVRPAIGPIEIQSHLDDTFTPEHAARQQQVRLGVGPNRLIAKELGSNQALFPNTNKFNRGKNERTILLIQK